MRVFLPNDSSMGIGGGWTFRRNLAKGGRGCFEVVDPVGPAEGTKINLLSYDVALVCGATMITRDTWRKLRDAPQPVVLRIDGIPEDWRNRGTGWPRLRDFAREADAVVYQSQFTKSTVQLLLGQSISPAPEGPIIYNGVDQSIFNPDGLALSAGGEPAILCVNYRKDPNKRIEEVIHRFRLMKSVMPKAFLTFVGQFPRDMVAYNFGLLDWQRYEDWDYLGPITDRELLARVMRAHDRIAFPSFADPCPNTLIEAMACGLTPIWLNPTGGAAEIAERWFEIDWSLERMAREYRELFDKVVMRA